MDNEKVGQPSEELQRALDLVLEAEPEKVVFMGKKRSIGWMKKGTMRKFSHVVVQEKNEWKRNVKLCAVVLLNGCFKLKLLYWVYWRWLYYVKDPDAVDVLRLVDAAKKKIPLEAFSLITILATVMTDLMMGMTKKEAAAIQAGQAGARRTL
jgi:hypothetical protein|nr:MAG TPA_asm: hypothetical protein [Caudoviricetes sp.]